VITCPARKKEYFERIIKSVNGPTILAKPVKPGI
jgi:hypothetical protein